MVISNNIPYILVYKSENSGQNWTNFFFNSTYTRAIENSHEYLFTYVTLFLVFVRLPIYCLYTQVLKNILSFRFFSPSHLHRSSPSFHQITSQKWLTPSFFNMHLWRHPGRAKMLCMHSKMIHKYTTVKGRGVAKTHFKICLCSADKKTDKSRVLSAPMVRRNVVLISKAFVEYKQNKYLEITRSYICRMIKV